ncbi:glycoside hydrolase family 2 TIM barrel-domain containing protein [Streptomyces flaveus]|uniref:Beta-galactosidase n=1 Tax=Streptomyces flaveus TaxID=66370 RepID=A0A917VBG4_9ACTN|nr:glycoside hydrolase family 2 TIM barrel-domain containing protein [Streptomyces flaveus]GGK59690.1 beta-galactosidase [Streptomyces flaveus]
MARLPMHGLRRTPEIDLTGEWQFRLLPHGTWKTVQVPDLWTMREDDDRPHYTNVPMPFPEVPPRVPQDNPVGVYRRLVDLSPQPGRRTILHVGAAEGLLHVTVNDRDLGTSTDSHLAAEFDITDAVQAGPNTIRLTVHKWSAASYLEDQDHWWQSGLSRPVRVYTVPDTRLADVRVVADYDPQTAMGALDVDVSTDGLDHLPESGWTVRIGVLGQTYTAPVNPRLAAATPPRSADARSVRPEPMLPADFDFSGLVGLKASGAPLKGPMRQAAEMMVSHSHPTVRPGTATFALGDLAVRPWSAEIPRLEGLDVELVAPDGTVVDRTSMEIGFRRVRIEGRDLLVNGERVLIQGVNRHDVDARTGRVVSRELMLAELSLLKRFNVNAIRTSHYPNDPYLLELADELGFYVVDEADIEAHAFTTTVPHDPRYLPEFLERVSRMVLRDRNHPSVVIWSLGNETGYGANHDAAAAWVRRFDPTRPVQYEGAIAVDWHGGHGASDIVCPMYPHLDALRAFDGDRPVILCEYAYAQGNSAGGLADYWELFETLPGLQGGFIWQFKDHALDPDGDGRYRYGGDFEDHPNDGPVLLNGLVFPDLTPKPAFYEARGLFSPVSVASDDSDGRRLTIRNRQFFADLSGYELELRVETEAGPTASRTVPTPAVAPRGEARIPIPDDLVKQLDDALALTVTVRTRQDSRWAPAGTEIAVHQVTFPRRPVVLPHGTAPTEEISHPLLRTPPRLCLWRALTDNDRAFSLDNRFERSGFFELVPVEGGYRTAWGDEIAHRRTIRQIGEADWVLSERVVLPEGTEDGLRVGMEFILVEGFEHARWTGLGPWENYPDRRASALLGTWESPVDGLAVPYIRPSENGGRGEVTRLEVRGPAGTVRTAHAPMHMTVGRHTVARLEAAAHWWELPPSRETVVHLDAAHRGVGMACLGPDTRPEFRLTATEYAWEWRLTLSTPSY